MRLFNSLVAFSGIGLVLSASGCGGNATALPMSQTRSPIVQAQAPILPAPTLEGAWTTSCLAGDSSVDKDFVSEQYVFYPDQTFTHTRSVFADSACQSTPTTVETLSGVFQRTAKITARFARANKAARRFYDTRGEALAIELVINAPLERVGKRYSVFRLEGPLERPTMYFGVLPYSEKPEDRGSGHIPALDVSKEFRRQ